MPQKTKGNPPNSSKAAPLATHNDAAATDQGEEGTTDNSSSLERITTADSKFPAIGATRKSSKRASDADARGDDEAPAMTESKFPATGARRSSRKSSAGRLSTGAPEGIHGTPTEASRATVAITGESEFPVDADAFDDNVRPGAVSVFGANLQPHSEHLSVDHNEDMNNNAMPVPNNNRVVAEIVDEDQLFQEMLSRRQHDYVHAENVVPVMMDSFEDLGNPDHHDSNNDDDDIFDNKNLAKKRQLVTNRIKAGVAVALLVVVAVVLVAVFVLQSNRANNHPSSASSSPVKLEHPTLAPGTTANPTISTTASSPTYTPVSRLKAFRTLLLNHSISSRQNLDDQFAPQYQALKWLAEDDKAMINISESSMETIIQRYALAVIFFADNGNNWRNRSNFLSSSSICEWRDALNVSGVLCAVTEASLGSSKVDGLPLPTELVLWDNNLVGTIPTELGWLSSLTSVVFSTNQLHGTIPTELGQLSNLADLSLDYNNIGGTIPTELGHLSNLHTRLQLVSNDLTGTIPTQLGKLVGVFVLELPENKLIGTIPTEMGTLSSITNLDFHMNQLTGTIPTQFGQLSHLTSLYLDNNNLNGTLPTELCKLSSLELLVLYKNNIQGTIPTELGLLSGLFELSLSGNRLFGMIPTELGKLIGLGVLGLGDNHLKGPFPAELGRLTDLQHLDLGGNQLTGTIPAELELLSKLSLLDLSKTEMSGTFPRFFANFSELASLYLHNTSFTGNLSAFLCTNRYWADLTADCRRKVDCSCCTACY